MIARQAQTERSPRTVGQTGTVGSWTGRGSFRGPAFVGLGVQDSAVAAVGDLLAQPQDLLVLGGKLGDRCRACHYRSVLAGPRRLILLKAAVGLAWAVRHG